MWGGGATENHTWTSSTFPMLSNTIYTALITDRHSPILIYIHTLERKVENKKTREKNKTWQRQVVIYHKVGALLIFLILNKYIFTFLFYIH